MRHSYCLYLLVVITVTLSGCISSHSTLTPIWTETHPPSPTSIPPTSVPTLRPTQTATLTPPVTLEPKQAEEAISKLLREPVDCEAPCFWGIMPGQSTLGEAKNIFTRLGLPLEYTITLDGKEFYGGDYDFDSGLSVGPTLAIQSNIVKNLTLNISPETQREGVKREWLTYSPETLINRYGTPSKIGFDVDRGAPRPAYGMAMYFDTMNLIIYYGSFSLGPKLQACPLTEQIDHIRIWMGKNPVYPPPIDRVPLEKATFMTMEEFSKLMTGDPDIACFNLKEEAFP